ncbi:hypothetical protein [Streptomyces sp. N502]|uniref:hypothetical protein n=1 Tax=Streptomyces sp. N502 TaxID=2730916 RepID=UPI0019D2536A|nr:hypothetical protein [Streptomyces sp. N502]
MCGGNPLLKLGDPGPLADDVEAGSEREPLLDLPERGLVAGDEVVVDVDESGLDGRDDVRVGDPRGHAAAGDAEAGQQAGHYHRGGGGRGRRQAGEGHDTAASFRAASYWPMAHDAA